jgi:hypothetical protein
MRAVAVSSSILISLALAACTPSVAVQQSAIKTVASNDDERHKLFEATLLMLDDHPEYVDELFTRMKEHPSARDKFLALATAGARDPAFAKLMTRRLVEHPEAVTVISTSLIDDVYTRPAAEKAFLAAMRARKVEISHMLVRDPETLGEVTAALAAAAPGEVGSAIKSKVTGKPEEKPTVAPKK